MKELKAIFITAAAVAAALFAGRGLLYSWVRRDAEAAYQAALVPIRVQRAQQWADFLNMLLYVALAAAVVVVAGLLMGIAMAVLRQRNLARAVPVGRDGLPAPMQYKLRDGTIVIFSPAMLPGAAAMIGPNGLQVLSDTNAVQMHQQNARVQAAAALQLPEVGRMPNAATWRAMAGGYEPKALPVPAPMLPAPVEAPAAPVRLLTAHSALRESAPDRWIVGQNHETGALAVFTPDMHAHAGIVGATGTGKTSSVGFTLAADAISSGHAVTILDPDGGASWRQFAPVAEWQEADYGTFADQVRALFGVFEARRRVMAAAGVSHYSELPPGSGFAPRVIIIEEFGDLYSRLRGASARSVDAWLDSIFRRGRKAGMSIVLIDQYPNLWSPAAVSGVKRLFVFKVGANQGVKVGRWDAQNLADRGEFLIPNEGGTRYQSFDTRGRVPSLLRALPDNGAQTIEGEWRALSASAQGLSPTESTESSAESHAARGSESTESTESTESGECVSGAAHTLPPATESIRSAPVRDYIWAGLDLLHAHGYTPTQALLRRWAAENGRNVGVGYVHDIFHQWKAERGIA